MNELRIELQIPQEKASICQKALAPETRSESLQRSEIKLEEFKQGLRISINAKDLSAMRAAINTYVRWVMMCFNIID